MSADLSGLTATYFAPADTDASAWEYRIVELAATASGARRVGISDGVDADVLGVVQVVGTGTAGQLLTVCASGECWVVAGAAFTPGTTNPDFISDANGAATPASAGDRRVGYLIFDDPTTAIAAGDVVRCVVSPGTMGAA